MRSSQFGNAVDLPLSFGEELMWRAEARGSWTVPFLECPQHLPIVLRVRGAIDRRALQAAFDDVLCRHDVLRSRFRATTNGPVRAIAPAEPITIRDADLRAVPDSDRAAALERLLDDHVAASFDLAQGPLVRVLLARLDTDDHVLAVVVHHIVFDGASRRLFVLDLGRRYDAHVAGTSRDVPAPTATYADYVAWQRGRMTADTLPRLERYWTAKLRARPDVRLPVDGVSVDGESTRSASMAFDVGAADLGRLRELARRQRASAAAALLAGFQLLLSRLTGVDDVLVGIPIADRRRLEFEEMIGLFSNVVIARTRVSAAATFADLVTRVRDDLREASNHQDLPYGRLVQLMPDERPPYRIVFNYMRAAAESIPKLGGLDTEEMDYAGPRRAVADLNLQVHEHPDFLSCRLFYKADCWTRDAMARVVGDLQSLLSSMLAMPTRPLVGAPPAVPCASSPQPR